MPRAPLSALLALCVLILIAGCAGRHFQDAGEPPAPAALPVPGVLPVQEYWTGMVFGNTRVGFTHFAVTPSKAHAGSYEIRSQAFMSFRFLGAEKKISLDSFDLVDKDLRLVSFESEHLVDSSRLRLEGSVKDGVLTVTVRSGNTSSEKGYKVEGGIYPGSATYLYLLMHGLDKGKAHEYKVFDTETQQVADVSQRVVAYERSDLFEGSAFRVRTSYLGQDITTWINDQGLPLYESTLSGVLVSRLESRDKARDYLVRSSLDKRESLLDFSLIRVAAPIRDPGRVTELEAFLTGIPEDLALPSDSRQVCVRTGDTVRCTVYADSAGKAGARIDERDAREYLKPSVAVPVDAPRIRSLAAGIAGNAPGGADRIRALLAWINENIGRESVDVFTALDVLEAKKAECQGHAYLYAAFARSLGIPTRVVNGIVYAGDFQGFLYHTWAESLDDGRWVAVDPTMGQFPADATHVKLVEGESMSSLTPLMGVFGRLGVEIGHIR